MMRASGYSARIARVASRPSMTGMLRSMRTRSGRSSRYFSRASSPLAASATTCNPGSVARKDTTPMGGVRSLLQAGDGSLWIVWAGGAVSHLSGGRLTSYGEHDGLPPTVQLTESGSGMVVAATVRGLARFFSGRWEAFGREWG